MSGIARGPRESGKRRRGDRATSAVEFSIIAPVLLLLSLVEAGLWFYGRNIAQTSAREGVSYLRLAGTNDDPGSFQRAAQHVSKTYAVQLGSLKDVKAKALIDSDTGKVTMVVSGTLDLPLGQWQVSQEAEATLEQFRGDPRGRTPRPSPQPVLRTVTTALRLWSL